MPYRDYIVDPQQDIRMLMARIDATAKGFAIVLDGEGRLVATITDGDIRRAILSGIGVSDLVQRLLDDRALRDPSSPVTAPHGASETELLQLMNTRGIRQVPLVDDDGRVVDVAFLHDLVKDFELPLRAVVMAGGFGRRLGALTENIPKPMLPVGDRPLLERLLQQFRRSGIRRVNITTHYKSEMISDHFGDGTGFGVDINYVHEDRPLGTAGALSLIESDEPILVMNGDILTKVNFQSMLEFHREHGADMTVGVRQCEFRMPYGVVECSGVQVTAISEKPVIRQLVNAGIYLLNPDVARLVPNDQHYDMPDLIGALLQAGRRVVSFPVTEYWLDIGQLADYERAQDEAGSEVPESA